MVVGLLVLAALALFFAKHFQRRSPYDKEMPQAALQPSATNPLITSVMLTNRVGQSNSAHELVARPWNADSFDRGLLMASNRSEKAEIRVLALQKLFSKRATLSDAQLLQFRQSLLRIAKDKSESPMVVAAALRSLVGLFDFLESRNLISKSEIVAESGFIVQYAGDPLLELQIRGAAIRATGDLGLESGRPVVEELLRNPSTLNVPELARNGCLALVKLAKEESLAPIRTVLQNTTESSVFGTAAHCLGQLNSAEAMSALVVNAPRFPDSGSCDAALVSMDKIVLETLKQPSNPQVIDAIAATEHLWKDGQREKYVSSLRSLLADSPLAVRKAACERLVDAAGRLPFSEEKRELSVALKSIGASPDLADYAERIRQRVGATILIPNTSSAPIPTEEKQ